MKKLLALVLALAMLLGCTALAETAAVDYTGTWVLTGMEAQGLVMGPSLLAMSGVDMQLKVNEDGTCAIVTNGEEEVGTWAATEAGLEISDSTETLVLTYADGVLALDMGGKLMFTREGAAPAVEEAANENVALANVAPEAFEGAWLLTSANAMGMEFTADMMGVYIAFVLDDGMGIYGERNDEGSVDQYPISYTVTEVEGVGTVLDLIYSGEEVEEPLVLLSLVQLQDGRLMFTLEQEGLEIIYYFTLQVEEAAE